MLTYTKLHDILNATKEERTNKITKKNDKSRRVKFKKGGTVQREHKQR